MAGSEALTFAESLEEAIAMTPEQRWRRLTDGQKFRLLHWDREIERLCTL